MYNAKPYQFVKEDKQRDYIFKRFKKYYVHSVYGGELEIEPEEYERLKKKGWKER